MRTTLLAGSTYLDLYDNESISLNYSIADIKNPENRNASFSKTINLPGSATNNQYFTEIFSVDLEGSFNPNTKVAAILASDTLEQINGYLQLINVKNENGKIEYEAVIFGDASNIFTEVGDAFLSDLDLSAYNHVYNRTAQVASWTAATGQGYVYPMIDYGFNNLLDWDVNHFFPAIYLKQYIDSIFTYAGRSYTSAFFSSDFFKRLIVPFNSDKLILTDSDITYRKFRATNTADNDNQLTSGTQDFTIVWDNDSTGGNNDPSGSYSTVTGKYTVPFTGKYVFRGNLTIQKRYEPSVAAYEGANQEYIYLQIVSSTAGILNSFQLPQGALYTAGSLASGNLSATATINVNVTHNCTKGEQIYIQVSYTPVFINPKFTTASNGQGGTSVSGDVYLRTKADGFFLNDVVNEGIKDGEQCIINNAIPQKIKMKELLSSVLKMFNLYMEEDKVTAKNYLIEPRNDFYAAGSTVDWTDKLDISKPIEIKPMGYLDARIYYFAYRADGDYYNKKYTDEQNGQIYGERKKVIDNDFLKETKTYDIIFSPTPSVGNGYNDRVIPTIVGIDQFNVRTPRASNIRLLYYRGVMPTNTAYNYVSTSGTTSRTTWPMSGHLDDPYTPTLDLNFGVPNKVYYTATSGTIQYTNNNLYNKYHKQFITEITDQYSKVVTMHLFLTPLDINTVSFRNRYFIDGTYYRLNKVNDHDPNDRKSIPCEFIRINVGAGFTPTSGTIVGGTTTIGDEDLPQQQSGSST